MTYTLDIVINQLPKTSNALGGHWRHKNNEMKLWRNLIALHTIGKRPMKPLKRAFVKIVRGSSVEPDLDNLYSSVKGPLDGLKHAEIILDDKPSNIELVCTWEKAAPKKGHIKINVLEIS